MDPVKEKKQSSTVKNRLELWDTYWGVVITGKCPCCKDVMMHRNEVKTWEQGHIKPAKYGGPTNIFNLIPICKKCNAEGAKTVTIYGRMVGLKTLAQYDAEVAEIKHERFLAKISLEDTGTFFHCIATGCTNNKAWSSLCCRVHRPSEQYHKELGLREPKSESADSIALYDIRFREFVKLVQVIIREPATVDKIAIDLGKVKITTVPTRDLKN
jgi:hypothetical protein